MNTSKDASSVFKKYPPVSGSGSGEERPLPAAQDQMKRAHQVPAQDQTKKAHWLAAQDRVTTASPHKNHLEFQEEPGLIVQAVVNVR